ncbi:MAG: hypothetical protein HY917_02530 [Candidatus Diapherotrites archaeon]|nr:hypothetical protein [Candidatus Diapherotrites archaeon]
MFSTPTNCSPLTGRLLLKDFSVTSGGIDLAIQNNSTGTITGITLSSSGLTAAGTNPASLGVGDSNAFSLTGTLSGSVNQAVTVSYNSADGLTKTETTTCVANIA